MLELFTVMLASFLLITQYRVEQGIVLPNQWLTPGAVRIDATAQQLCAPRFTTKKYRHTTGKVKIFVYREYGMSGPNDRGCKGGCEIDHLVPLTLGGADMASNLWPQPSEPRPGFHEKDALENRLHRLMCQGKVTLSEAQKCIRSDWHICSLVIEKRFGK